MREIIVDSAMSFSEALAEKEIPDNIRKTLSLVEIPHYSFDGKLHQGQLVVHADVAQEIRRIFDRLAEKRFPIARVIPIVAYGWDDDRSMVANNTSAFNYRPIRGTDRLSCHSFGLAIDINPALNPCIQYDGEVVPPGARYDPGQPGTVTADIAPLFKSCGWEWGGDWHNKDWQHFQKTV